MGSFLSCLKIVINLISFYIFVGVSGAIEYSVLPLPTRYTYFNIYLALLVYFLLVRFPYLIKNILRIFHMPIRKPVLLNKIVKFLWSLKALTCYFDPWNELRQQPSLYRLLKPKIYPNKVLEVRHIYRFHSFFFVPYPCTGWTFLNLNCKFSFLLLMFFCHLPHACNRLWSFWILFHLRLVLTVNKVYVALSSMRSVWPKKSLFCWDCEELDSVAMHIQV